MESDKIVSIINNKIAVVSSENEDNRDNYMIIIAA